MSDRHLREAALEALAHGRGDLVDDADRLHVAGCPRCRGALAEARELSTGTAALMNEALPVAIDMEALVANALATAAPVPARRGLLVPGIVAALVAAGLVLGGAAWAGELPSIEGVLAAVRDTITVVGAVDQVVSIGVPGGWAALATGGVLLLGLLLLPLRRLVRGRVRAPGLPTAMLALAALLAIVTSGGSARALTFEGEWPDDERLDITVRDQPPAVVLRRAAAAAGLDFVASGLPDAPVRTVDLTGVTLKDVVVAALGQDAPFVVRREEGLVTVRPEPGAATRPSPPPEPAPPLEPPPISKQPPSLATGMEAPPTPAVPPLPSAADQARDRTSFGGDIDVRQGEVVRSVFTTGGDADIRGEVLSDVVTTGGDIDVREGGVVHGQLVSTGGDIHVHEGGAVHGEIVSMGGDITIDEGAQVPGAGTFQIAGSDRDEDSGARRGGPGGKVERFIKDAVFRAAVYLLLFVIGLIFLGAAPERLGALQRIMVREPFRVVATGLLTVAGAIVGCIVLAITIIGIPLAVVLGLATFVAGYIGLVAAAGVIGAVLPIPSLKDRRVLQLAAGLAILYVASLLPWGTLFAFMAACIGLGAIVLTRFRKTAPGEA